MPKGGARSRSGPPPDPNALRRDRPDDGEWTTLPAEGRDGEAPEWPLSDPTPRELGLWVTEWARPQAVAWEASGLEHQVALYVRQLVDAESHRATVGSRQEARRMMDSLGLTVPGLRSNRWKIGEVAAASSRPSRRSSSKSRLKVVSDADTA